MTIDPGRQVRIGVQIRPQHADYAQIRRACFAAEYAEYGFAFGTPAERSRQQGLARAPAARSNGGWPGVTRGTGEVFAGAGLVFWAVAGAR
ncbi:hypothetical protein EAS64_09990 [Trebonia kvetii]|uniref:Uncharacterized protein n=1 Tax=Trebonia kvetii TaxID=2480626 RepID=A0A6P2C0N3_9ACTN|nr:hypothetical protein [Trebonia kvetii]TVZ04952.1 hypothetical protein EAS64_09990 [Trebonia kvetii]